jgi:threonyl-tRNA synthetase
MEAKNLEAIRHSAAHVLAQALKRLYGEVRLGIGPAITNGFYYDIEMDHRLVPEDLPIIEDAMKAIVKENLPIQSRILDRAEALELFTSLKEPFKLELIRELAEGEAISIFEQGEFSDLCKGPHIEKTGQLKFFKLLSIAGAYWRGNEKNPMLQRIYGTAFASKEDLKLHLFQLEEAKKRDHRKLGRELKLFFFDDSIGSGLPVWLPRGAKLRDIIERYEIAIHERHGYQMIRTPHLGLTGLWETSGHLSFYRESMFPSMEVDSHQHYMVKPMNCPFHMAVYNNEMHSYRELPLRLFELASVYRNEKSGVLHGLLRVRGFTQDDAHIFCMPEQLEDEIARAMKLTHQLLHDFGFDHYKIYLSTRDKDNKKEKYIGDSAQWDIVEQQFEDIVRKLDIEYQVDPGEAKFYGPAIDVKINDALGREWQCTTIQVDFNLPERFKLRYIGEDGQEHIPMVIHRALLGSMERFISILLEHYGGDLPLWLAPEQLRLVPISDENLDYAREVLEELNLEGFRVTLDQRNERMNAKIRLAEHEKIPFVAVIGKSEEAGRTLSIRRRKGENLGNMSIQSFKELMLKMIEEKSSSS